MGQQVPVQRYRYYRPFSHTFLGTALWVLPCMVLLLAAGFLLARDYFVPRYLEHSDVKVRHLEPVRVLSPAEARAAARDEPSPVWTKGVRPSDIPRLEPADPERRAAPRPRRETTTAPTPAPPPAPAPGAAEAPPALAPAPAPTIGGGDAEPIPED